MARYTILAHAPDGFGALLQHHDQPTNAFWWTFTSHHIGVTRTSRLVGDPENEHTGPDWIHDFPLKDGAGPEFDTIDEVQQYLRGFAGDHDDLLPFQKEQ